MRHLKFVHPKNWIIEWKLQPGDQVIVISGKAKGSVGCVQQTDKMRNAISVEGVKERVVRADGKSTRVPGFIHVSNVMLMDPEIGVPTRLALRRDDKGRTVRIARKSGCLVPWPDPSTIKFGAGRQSVQILKTQDELTNAETHPYTHAHSPTRKRTFADPSIHTEPDAPDGPKDTPKEFALIKTYEYQHDRATMDAIRQMLTKYNRELH